jgi:predicted 3-demethylubiquinone-9 3-methyltransferase (glyoxalase superfamily)
MADHASAHFKAHQNGQELIASIQNNESKGDFMQKITTFLWFNDQAEEAANFYVSLFKNSKIVNVARYGAAGPGPAGTVMVVTFELDGRQFQALNGGPQFKFTEAISLVVNCETQQELDEFWEQLSAGGEKSQCGWLKDKYGLSWQVVPTVLDRLLLDKDAAKASRVMQAMLQMGKLDIARLRQAYDQA